MVAYQTTLTTPMKGSYLFCKEKIINMKNQQLAIIKTPNPAIRIICYSLLV
jgi:hypothetical protein